MELLVSALWQLRGKHVGTCGPADPVGVRVHRTFDEIFAAVLRANSTTAPKRLFLTRSPTSAAASRSSATAGRVSRGQRTLVPSSKCNVTLALPATFDVSAEVESLVGHGDRVWSVAFSPRRAASGVGEQRLHCAHLGCRDEARAGGPQGTNGVARGRFRSRRREAGGKQRQRRHLAVARAAWQTAATFAPLMHPRSGSRACGRIETNLLSCLLSTTYVVRPVGLEPTTNGLKGRCSTD